MHAGVRVSRLDQNLSALGFRFSDRVEGIHDQVQDDLLQLNTVSLDRMQCLVEAHLKGDGVLHRFALCQCDGLNDQLVKRQPICFWWRLPDEISNPAEHLGGTTAVTDDPRDC